MAHKKRRYDSEYHKPPRQSFEKANRQTVGGNASVETPRQKKQSSAQYAPFQYTPFVSSAQGQSSSAPHINWQYDQPTSSTQRQPSRESRTPVKINLNQAISEGIGSIIEEQPRFNKLGQYLTRYIDPKTIRERAEDLAQRAAKEGLDKDETQKYIQKELADYVSSAQAFNDKGKRLIIGTGNLEEKTGGLGDLWRRLIKRPRLFDGSKYLDKTLAAADDMYELFKTGDYAKRMPELVKSVTTLYDSGFLDAAVETLRVHEIVDNEKYRFLKQKVYSKAKAAAGGMVSGVEKYATAAAIFAILGLGILALNTGITGAVIGTSAKISGGLAGIILVILSCILFLVSPKKR